MDETTPTPEFPPSAVEVGYAMLLSVAEILNELSGQGLEFWIDDTRRWRWRWQGTPLEAQTGFWAIGEALVDAVVTRFPHHFDIHLTPQEP